MRVCACASANFFAHFQSPCSLCFLFHLPFNYQFLKRGLVLLSYAQLRTSVSLAALKQASSKNCAKIIAGFGNES